VAQSREELKAMFAKASGKERRKLELDLFFHGEKDRKKAIEKLVTPKLKVDKFGNKIFEMDNARLDFKAPFVFKGVTKSGNVKLGEIVMSSPEGIKTRNIIGKPALGSSGERKELFVMNFSFIEDL
jgi:hypothetical protein